MGDKAWGREGTTSMTDSQGRLPLPGHLRLSVLCFPAPVLITYELFLSLCGCSVFLREEREKLAAYRDATRAAYAEAGKGAELAAELPAPLAVGQRVSAKHPKTRQVAEGAILTVDSKGRSRVQFDRRELGSEIVEVRQHRPQEREGGWGIRDQLLEAAGPEGGGNLSG
jgi:hypothetical protein